MWYPQLQHRYKRIVSACRKKNSAGILLRKWIISCYKKLYKLCKKIFQKEIIKKAAYQKICSFFHIFIFFFIIINVLFLLYLSDLWHDFTYWNEYHLTGWIISNHLFCYIATFSTYKTTFNFIIFSQSY